MSGRNALLAAATCAVLLSAQSVAGEVPRGPVRADTLLDRRACSQASRGGRLIVAKDIALGLVAFNTPYLFGGRALRTGLTCGACHGWTGPSGAAARLTFRRPLPELYRVARARSDLADFVRHAVITEFDGPPLRPDVAEAVSALLAVIAPASSTPNGACRVSASSLVAIALALIADGVGRRDPDELIVLVDSARFVLGEMTRTATAGVSSWTIAETNRALHDLEPLIDARDNGAGSAAARVSSRWAAALTAQGLPVFALQEDPSE